MDEGEGQHCSKINIIAFFIKYIIRSTTSVIIDVVNTAFSCP